MTKKGRTSLEIFIRVEVFAREFDSKLLLGLIAAGRGHRAFVCDLPTVMRRIARRATAPRLIHMKDLEPTATKKHFHRIFRATRCLVTSLDEEAGTLWSSYSDFASLRYGDTTVGAADAVFCWGDRDYNYLINQYSDQREKFHKTGSPRVDLWGPRFSRATRASGAPFPKNFVLVCTSVGSPMGWALPHQRIAQLRRGTPASPDSWNRERSVIGEYRDSMGELVSYLDLIRFLSERKELYDILVKPHPSENPDAWRILLKGFRGVSVTTAPTSELIRSSRALITSVSTTAIEALFSGVNLITYAVSATPSRSTDLIVSLGHQASKPEDVELRLGELFSSRSAVRKPELSEAVKARFFSNETELAAERIVRVWETLGENSRNTRDSPHIPDLSFLDFRYWVSSAFPSLASGGLSLFRLKTGATTKQVKYPTLDRVRVQARVKELEKSVGLEGKVTYRFIGRKSVLFEPVR